MPACVAVQPATSRVCSSVSCAMLPMTASPMAWCDRRRFVRRVKEARRGNGLRSASGLCCEAWAPENDRDCNGCEGFRWDSAAGVVELQHSSENEVRRRGALWRGARWSSLRRGQFEIVSLVTSLHEPSGGDLIVQACAQWCVLGRTFNGVCTPEPGHCLRPFC